MPTIRRSLRNLLVTAFLLGASGVAGAVLHPSHVEVVDDHAGHTTLWGFDASGLLALEQHPDGATRRSAYDGCGRQVSLTDELDRVTTLSYDQRDRVLLTAHPDGSAVVLSYDDAQRVHTRTNELGRTHTTRFDALGRKTQETDAQGQHQFWEYDANGNVEQFRDARQALTTYTYDDADRLVQIQEPEAKLTTRSYFGTGSVRTERIGQGTELRETVYERNHPRDVPTRIIRKGIGEPDRTLTLGYDGEGRVAFQSDALSRSTTWQYDAFGRERERIEPMGRRTESIYDGMGRKLSETVSGAGTGSFTLRWTYDNRGFARTATDRSGATSQHRYDAAGQRIESIDAEGRVSRWDYDVRGRVLRETLPGSGRVGVYTYDAVGNRIREDLPNAHPRHHVYDALNRRIRTHDELGDVETLAYDPLGAITRRTDAEGHATTYTLDDRGRVTLESRPAGRTLSRTWTVHDQLASETDARSHTVTTRWNAFGEVVEQTDPLGTQRWQFDAGGRLEQHTDRAQRVTTYTHDALDRRTGTAWPSLDLSETRAYDPLDRVIRETDRNGIDTVYTLDPEGRIRQRQRAGRTETFQYDRTGKLLSQTDGLGRRTTFGYDAAGRKESETRPLERTLRWTYGPGDEVLTETNGAGETTTHRYDRRLRRIESENPLRQITRMDYDGRGLLTTRTAPNSAEHVWTLAYDTAGRLESVTDPERHTTTYGYDTSDNLTSITEPGGGVTLQDYDALNRRTRKQTADIQGQPAQIWSWTRDAEGNVLIETRPDGSTATHTYDVLNRRLTSTYASAPTGSPQSRAYTWDGNSNLTRISETTAGQTTAIETQYDPHNRPVQLTDAWNRVWTQAFDDADQRTALTSPGVPGIQWTYDAGSRPVQINVEGAGAYTLSYDPADRNTGITHPNAAETTHAFDAAGRIIDIQHQRAGALTRYQYTYDANGNRLTQTETHGNQTIASSFAYDKADRLTAITEPDKHTAYTLDGSSNRVEVREGATVLNAQRKYTAEFNARNQLTEQKQYADNAVTATTSFHYDPNGNLIRQSTGGMDTEWRYDILDRLIETTPPTGPPTQYKYGPGDVRIAKVRNGEEVRYHYDSERITLETNTLGNPQRHYVYSAAGLLNTTLLGTTPQYRSSHLDAMGSPVLITGSDGSVISRTRFDAWGVEQPQFGTRDQVIAFQGYWTGTELEETGTLLSAARLYIPGLGIFAERDPVEGTSVEPITFNPYLLGRGNPNYWSDPDGRHSLALTLFRIGAEVGRRSVAWAGHVIAGAALAYVADAQIDYINQRYQAEFAGYSEANRPPQSFDAKPTGPSIYSTPGEQQNLPSNTAHAYPELSKEIATGILPGRQAEPVAPTVFTTPALREDEKGPNVLVFPQVDQQFQQVMRSDASNDNEVVGGSASGVYTEGGHEVVYQHRTDYGEINYYGITCNPSVRACQHRVDADKTGSTMEVISGQLTHGVARTIEAKLIRKRLDDARRDGLIDGTEPIQEQLAKAGLTNKNRGRDPSRWEAVDPEDVIEESGATFDIRTPKKHDD